MTFKSYLKLVEIQTKAASVIPFMLGTVYTIYRYNTFKFINFLLMFIALFTFDMATTAINNYMDYKKAKKTYGYNYETHNAIVQYGIKEKTVVLTILLQLIIASVFGFFLFLNTSIIVLGLGAISFLIGILYSLGPVPISRTFLGEFFSGATMGFGIPFLAMYIHIYDQYDILSLGYESGLFTLSIDVIEIGAVFLVSLSTIASIANIMLANNICDIEDDRDNNRYTLPIYIGKEKALGLFRTLYYLIYINICLLVVLKIAPIYMIIGLITFIPVRKNIQLFFEKQTKKDTFILAVKNFMMINVPLVLLFTIGLFL